MSARDLWRRIVLEALASDFGREAASVLASLPLAERRGRIREWDACHSIPPALSPPIDPRDLARRKLEKLTHILQSHRTTFSSAALTALNRDAVELQKLLAEPRETDLPQVAGRLRNAECVLFFLGPEAKVDGRRFSIEGDDQVQELRLMATKGMTQKSRVQLMLEDFERYHKQVPEKDRVNVEQWLGKLRDLHRSYEGIVDRVKGVLRAEEELVRDGFACNLQALEGFTGELVDCERELRGLQCAGRVPWRT